MTAHEEHWAGFPSEFDDAPALVTVDLGWAEADPDPNLHTLLIVRVAVPQTLSPDEDLGEFLEAIEPFDDALVEGFAENLDAVPVGTLLTDKHRWWCFYAPGAEAAEAAVEAAVEACPGLVPELMVEEDPEWGFYEEVLFPDESQQRFIADESVVDQLQDHGDNGEIPREIEHLAVMPDAASRDRFVQWCGANGFEVTDAAKEADPEVEGFAVEFTHTGPAITEEVWEKTMLATEGAEKCGGEYDGWQSPVMKG